MRTLAVLLLFAAPAFAQTPPPPTTIPLNRAVTAVFTHDGVATTGYRVYLDGTQQGPDLEVAPVAGEVRLPVPAISVPGLHLLEVSAYNDTGESAKGQLSLFVGPPTAPGPVRIEITTTTAATVEPGPDGRLTVRIDGVTTTATVR